MTERTLDRIPQYDPRNRSFPIRTLLAPRSPRSYTWRLGQLNLDQGTEGACVGFSWAQEMAARPVVIPTTVQTARSLYFDARTLDQWPGEDYEGTSVLAGAKAVQRLGHMSEYRWAFGVQDVVDALA